jgi:hypothetical protein
MRGAAFRNWSAIGRNAGRHPKIRSEGMRWPVARRVTLKG